MIGLFSNLRDISFNFWGFLKLFILFSEGLKSCFLVGIIYKDGKHSKSPISKSRIPHVEFQPFLLLDVWIRPFRKFPHLDFCGRSTLSTKCVWFWVFILITYKIVIHKCIFEILYVFDCMSFALFVHVWYVKQFCLKILILLNLIDKYNDLNFQLLDFILMGT